SIGLPGTGKDHRPILSSSISPENNSNFGPGRGMARSPDPRRLFCSPSAGLVLPGRLPLRALGKPGIYVFLEFDFAVQYARLHHHVANQVEIRLIRRQRRVRYAIERIGESPLKQSGTLSEIQAGDEKRGRVPV